MQSTATDEPFLAAHPGELRGDGLVLRPWDADLIRQAGHWGVRGFPYHAFDLAHLQTPEGAAAMLQSVREPGPHRHFVAVEDGTAVGRVAVNLRDPAGLYIWGVHVPPEHEGRAVCRRMLATLMRWLEPVYPGRPFVLNTTAFAEHAHRAYYALGFELAATYWHFDRELAEQLWRVPQEQRKLISPFLRFYGGRWEVRTYTLVREPGSPMSLGTRSR